MDLYTEIILDHYKNPRNYGSMSDFSGKAEEYNVMCGDKLTFYLKTDHNQRVSEVKFEGVGCAISQAGASMLSEKLLTMKLKEIEKIDSKEIMEMLNIPISPMRVKCVVLGLYAAKKAARNVGWASRR